MKNLTLTDLDPCSFIIGWTYRDADYNTVMQKVDELMNNILAATQAEEYLGFLGGSSCFRHQVAVTKKYKGNRSKQQPEWLQQWKQPICDHLVKEWGALVVDGIEADDALSICHKHYSPTHQITIASPDKDLRQLEGMLFDFKKWEHHLIDGQQASYNFWHSMLVGDSADNIAALPGCGPKGAEMILASHTLGLTYPEAVRQAYLHKGCTDAYFQEQYTLLKMLEEPAYGFVVPSPLPVPVFNPLETKQYTQPATTTSSTTNFLGSLGLDE